MAKRYQFVRRGGTCGPLTGSQFFNKLNCTLLNFGQEMIQAPVPKPQFGALAVANLQITNVNNAITIKLTCPSDPGDSTILRASPPLSQGVEVPGAPVVLGMVPAPVLGASDITLLYTNKHGAPAAGDKIFVTANQHSNGWESIPQTFSAIVPAAS